MDANGTAVVNEYDNLNRLIERTITPGVGVSHDTTFERYRYDGLSRVVLAVDDDSTVSRKYDSLDHVIEETVTFGVAVCNNGVVEAGEECEPPGTSICDGQCYCT